MAVFWAVLEAILEAINRPLKTPAYKIFVRFTAPDDTDHSTEWYTFDVCRLITIKGFIK